MRFNAIICGLFLITAPILQAQGQDKSALINQLHQREWVRLEADGKVQGRVVVIEGSDQIAGRVDNKVLLSREGKVVYQTKTGTDGFFEIKGVAPGAYALQAIGDYTFAAFAIHILPADASHLSSSLDVYASTIGNKARQQLLASTIVPADLEFGQDVYYRSHSTDPIAKQRQFNKNHQVTLRDGDLVGRVSRPGWAFSEQDLSDSVVRVMKSGEVVAQATVDQAGYYKVERLEPGIYDLLVAGGDGFAAFKFEAVAPSKEGDQAAVAAESGRFVSANLIASDCLGCELISQPEISCCEPAPIVEEVVADCGCAPMTGGGCCGGGGFGGGGGVGGGGAGGAGGFGAIAGLAALGLGIAALADDDDPVPATPIGP